MNFCLSRFFPNFEGEVSKSNRPIRRHLRTVQTMQPRIAAIWGSDWPAAARSVISTRPWKEIRCPRRVIEPPADNTMIHAAESYLDEARTAEHNFMKL